MVSSYAELLLMKGQVDEAMKEIEKAIRLDPSNPLPFINKVRRGKQGRGRGRERRGCRLVRPVLVTSTGKHLGQRAALSSLEPQAQSLLCEVPDSSCLGTM